MAIVGTKRAFIGVGTRNAGLARASLKTLAFEAAFGVCTSRLRVAGVYTKCAFVLVHASERRVTCETKHRTHPAYVVVFESLLFRLFAVLEVVHGRFSD